jgi:hypothetical protein
VELIKSDSVAAKLCCTSDKVFNGLNKIFKDYGIPHGCLQKLFVFEKFHYICFLVDDSGSMRSKVDKPSDALIGLQGSLGGGVPTRFTEACHQVLTMLKILQFVPKGTIQIRFLNRDKPLMLKQELELEETPEQFYDRCEKVVLQAFRICEQHHPRSHQSSQPVI